MIPEPSTIAYFCAAAMVLLIIPGPSVIYIVTRSIDQGRTAGIVSVLGISTGTMFHALFAAIGLSALVVSSAVAFTTVKYLGAAYLIYLGIRRLTSAPENELDVEVKHEPLRRIYLQGIVVNILNPKTALFFLAFLPQFVDPSRGAVPAQFMFFGFLLATLGLLSDGSYALLASFLGDRLKRGRFNNVRHYVSGVIYLLLGISAAIFGSRSKTA